MGGTTGFREAVGLGEALEYGRRAPVRRSLVEDRGEALRPSLAVALGRNALRRSGVSSGLVEKREDKPLPPGVIDEVYRNKRTGEPISKNRQSAVEGIVRILQENGRTQSSVIGVGGEAKSGTQGGRPVPRSPKTGQPGTQAGDVLRRPDSNRPGQKGTQSGEVETEREKPKITKHPEIKTQDNLDELEKRAVQFLEDLRKAAEQMAQPPDPTNLPPGPPPPVFIPPESGVPEKRPQPGSVNRRHLGPVLNMFLKRLLPLLYVPGASIPPGPAGEKPQVNLPGREGSGKSLT